MSINRVEAMVQGIIHWWDDDLLVRSIGRRIDLSEDNGGHFKSVCKLNFGFGLNPTAGGRLGRRLFRSNVKHCIRIRDELFIVFAAGRVFQLEMNIGLAQAVSTIRGSRPLRIAVDGNSLMYGEYRPNLERSPIRIWRSDDFGKTWFSVHTFDSIRHVHGVFRDPFDGSIWITTGDIGREAAIWRTDNQFKSLEIVLQGSQQTRAIDILFEKDCIWFGTDAPNESNFIFKLPKASAKTESVQQVGGPIFHAKTVGSSHFFSTACEPSKVNSTTAVEVWKVEHDKPSRIATYKKDLWSMKYFQYGQVLFPAGPGKNSRLWLTPFATHLDQNSLMLATG